MLYFIFYLCNNRCRNIICHKVKVKKFSKFLEDEETRVKNVSFLYFRHALFVFHDFVSHASSPATRRHIVYVKTQRAATIEQQSHFHNSTIEESIHEFYTRAFTPFVFFLLNHKHLVYNYHYG